jgi:hypothetical protein
MPRGVLLNLTHSHHTTRATGDESGLSVSFGARTFQNFTVFLTLTIKAKKALHPLKIYTSIESVSLCTAISNYFPVERYCALKIT